MKATNNNVVGNRIRSLRESKGITQVEMCVYFGVTQSNYSRLEKCDKRIDIQQLVIFGKVLDTTIYYLLFGI